MVYKNIGLLLVVLTLLYAPFVLEECASPKDPENAVYFLIHGVF